MTFSATDAAFEGFRVTRANPIGLLIWSLVWLGGIVAMAFVMMPLIMPYATEIQAAKGVATALSAEATAAASIAMLAILPIGLIVQALLAPAIYRAVLNADRPAFGGIKLGRDEVRMLAVALGLGAISLGLNAGGEALTTIVTGSAGALAGSLIALAVSIFTIWTSVRLSLVAPVTFQRHKISFVEGWALTARHFWPLLGMMVLTIVMAIVVIMLLVLVGWPLSLMINAAAANAGGEAVGSLFAAVLMLVLLPVGLALVSVLLWAPFAVAARDISAP